MAICPQCMNQVPDGAFCANCGAPLQYQALVHQLPAGTILTDGAFRSYEIGAVKGQGGFGITYVAQDLRRKTRVAIKEYYPMQCAQREGICVAPQTGCEAVFAGGQSNFLKEAQMLAALPALDSVVQIMDYFEVNGTAYIVMEYLDGTPLYQLVMQNGAIESNALFTRLPKLMRDLKVLHDAGIIHRDISPDNIMWMPDGTLKLLDFGSARHLEDGKSVSIQLKHGFAPVEQYRTKGQGPYTDIYALCATIYYCITGLVPPHPVERLEEDRLQAPSQLGISLDRSWEDALLWGLTVQPAARPQETEVLLQRMFPGGFSVPACFPEGKDDDGSNKEQPVEPGRRILPGSDSGKTPQKPIPTSVKVAVAAAGAAVILLIALVAVLLGGKDEPIRQEPEEQLQVQQTPVREEPAADMEEPEEIPAAEVPAVEEPREETPAEETLVKNGFRYTVVDGAVHITGYDGGHPQISVPDTIDDLPVTRLCSGAFENCSANLLILPENLEVIEEGAFRNCENLQYLSIPVENGTVSCYDTFAGCDRLRVLLTGQGCVLEGSFSNRILVLEQDRMTPVGAICDVMIDPLDVILGITDQEQYVLLWIPETIEVLDLYEQYEEETPIAYVLPGALETNPNLKELHLGAETIIEKQDMDNFPGEVYFYDGGLAASWIHGVYLADFAASLGHETTVDLALTREAMDFVGQYYVANMDENFWIDLLYEAGISYSSGTAVKMACDVDELVDVLCDEIEAIYTRQPYGYMAVAYSYSEEDGAEFLLICYNP